jgi:hypothetical protein
MLAATGSSHWLGYLQKKQVFNIIAGEFSVALCRLNIFLEPPPGAFAEVPMRELNGS